MATIDIYEDETFLVIKKEYNDSWTSQINSYPQSMTFTSDSMSYTSPAFLDKCIFLDQDRMVCLDNNRTPTHTDHYLNW